MNNVVVFRQMNAEAGIEMTYEEARVNYAACMTALTAVTDEENPKSVDEIIDMMQQIADPCFHPGVCRKFLTEAIRIMESDNDKTP